jgi:hypothetical protein
MIKFVSQRPVLGFPPLSYMYVLDMSILPLSVILWLDFGTVPTVWYFLFTSGAGTACLGFCRGSVFSLQCSICISLFAPLSFSSFGHCIVCLLAIVLSVLRFTASDYSFGIINLFLQRQCINLYSAFTLYERIYRLCHTREELDLPQVSDYFICMKSLRARNKRCKQEG